METFFTKDKNFYKVFFRLMLVVALQNLVAYSVNMLDNMMLGSYDQNALSGAATVNQIFFVVNQLAIAIGNALIVMSSQYWGKKDTVFQGINCQLCIRCRWGIFGIYIGINSDILACITAHIEISIAVLSPCYSSCIR